MLVVFGVEADEGGDGSDLGFGGLGCAAKVQEKARIAARARRFIAMAPDENLEGAKV